MDPGWRARLLVTAPHCPAGRYDARILHGGHERRPLAGIRRTGAHKSHSGSATHAGPRTPGGGACIADTDSICAVDASAGDFHLVRGWTRVGACETTHTVGQG